MTDWIREPPNEKLLRLFIPGEGWKKHSDKLTEAGDRVEAPGSARLIESVFINSLNATNLLLLTGTGSSFAASNIAGKPQPAGMATLWNNVQDRVGAKEFTEVCKLFSHANIDKNIEKLLTLCKIYIELNTGKQEKTNSKIIDFVAKAEDTIIDAVDFVDRETKLNSHSTIIQKIGRRGQRKPRAKFYTTNYDLCFEEAARRQRFSIIDGFSHSHDQLYDRSYFDLDIVRRDSKNDTPNYIENIFHLYKLHGSVDWRRVDSEIIRSREKHGTPVLIYPRSSKYQEAFDNPYLDMIGSLQSSLREPDTALIVSGFGFNDDHISRPIFSAIESNMSLRLVICDPAFIPLEAFNKDDHIINTDLATNNSFLKDFYRLSANGDPRVHLLNGRFSDMALAIPDLVGETDRERHASRMRILREQDPQ